MVYLSKSKNLAKRRGKRIYFFFESLFDLGICRIKGAA